MKKSPGKTLFRFHKQEKGAALILAMAFMIVAGLAVIPLLTFSNTGIRSGQVYNNKANTLYAADSGIEDAKWQIKFDQLSGKFATYDSHDYSTVWSYNLPQVNGKQQINNKNVNVTLKNNWIPKSIPAPDTATADAIMNNTKLMVTGGPFGATSYNIVITFYPQVSDYNAGGTLKLNIKTVGVWLPPGYTYKANSSNLGFEPAVSGYQGGQAVVWTFGPLVFTSLPGVNPTNSPMTAKITFNYTPSTTLSAVAAAGSTSISVASTAGFPASGSVSLQGESFSVNYTGITSTSFTGIPASGNGAITVAHSSGEPVGLGNKPEAVSWVDTTGVTGLSYTWDDTVRIFHIISIGSTAFTTLSAAVSAGNTSLGVVSTAGFPSSGSLTLSNEPATVTYTGKTATTFTGIPASGSGRITLAHGIGEGVAFDATSVETYVAKSELLKTGGALNGDYYATGNSLMRDIDGDGVKEHTTNSSAIVAAPNPAGADNGVPDDANVSASYLYWGTWYISDYWAQKNSVSNGNRCHTLFTDTCSQFFGGAALNYDGSNWSSMTSGTGNTLSSVWGSANNNVFAVGLNGTILKYNGTSWSSMTSGTGNTLNSVWGSSGTDVFAVGLSGTILHYNGTSWSSMTSGTGNTLNGVWGGSSSNVFAVGLNGTILKYNGTSWSSMTSGTGNTLSSVWGSSGTDVFAVGLSGAILHYNGTSWSSMTSGTGNTLSSVWGSASNKVFAVGLNGTILKYNGTSWSSMTSGTGNTLNSVWGSSGTNVFAVGSNSTILKYNGTSWSSMTGGTGNFNSVWGSSSSNVFAVGSGGNFSNGSDWSVYNNSNFRANGNNDADASTNRDLTEHSSFAFDLGTYPSPTWVFTLSWEQWYSGAAPTSNDGLDFYLSNDGGTTWSSPIQAFRGSGVGSSGTTVFSCYQYQLPTAYLTSNFKIKFHVVGFNTSNQYLNVDDIRVNALDPDTGMTFKINNGSGDKIVYFDANGNPATSTDPNNKVIANETQVILTYSFGGSNPEFSGFAEACFRDVTPLVTRYAAQPVAPATNFNGHATYSAVGDLGDTGTNTSAFQLAHAGWSLVTVFTGPETLGHQLYLYDNFFGSGNDSSGIHVVWNGDGSSGGTIKGFVVPQQIQGETNAAKLTCFVTEGDNQLAGDYIAMNNTKLWDGTSVDSSNTKTNPTNVWNAHSYLSGGYTMYDGVDIYTLGIDPTAATPQYITWQSQILKPGDTSATLDLYTKSDYFFMVYMIISFRSETTTGGSLNYLIHG